jgi:hypothetical protein
MSPPQARDWARRQGTSVGALDPGSPGSAAPIRAPASHPAPYLVAVAWGTVWRYAVVGAVTLVMFAGLRPPLAVGAGVAVAGVVLGLWLRRWWIAGLWRAAVLGWAIGMTSPYWVFPYVIAAALAVVTVEPWVTARRPRGVAPPALPERGSRARARGRSGGRPELPGPEWPQARRRR